MRREKFTQQIRQEADPLPAPSYGGICDARRKYRYLTVYDRVAAIHCSDSQHYLPETSPAQVD